MLNDKHRRGKEMIKYAKQIVLMLGILFVGFTGAWWLSQAAVEEYGRGESVRLVVSKTLPQLDGKQLELRAVEVNPPSSVVSSWRVDSARFGGADFPTHASSRQLRSAK